MRCRNPWSVQLQSIRIPAELKQWESVCGPAVRADFTRKNGISAARHRSLLLQLHVPQTVSSGCESVAVVRTVVIVIDKSFFALPGRLILQLRQSALQRLAVVMRKGSITAYLSTQKSQEFGTNQRCILRRDA
jgi:hypothetical protein